MKIQKKTKINRERQISKNTNSVNQKNSKKQKIKLSLIRQHRITQIKSISFLATLVIGLFINQIGYGDIIPLSERTPQVRDAIVAAVPDVSVVEEIMNSHLAKIQTLNLSSLNISILKSGDFSGLTGLLHLNLFNNRLNRLPANIFEGLTSLKTLRLSRNVIEPFPLAVSLKTVGNNQFRAEMSTGAPFNVVVPVKVTNGTITRDSFNLTIPTGNMFSDTVTVSRTPSTTQEVTADISRMPGVPQNHFGYFLYRSDFLPLELKIEVNTYPEFREGIFTTRSLDWNLAEGGNIGDPVSASDAEKNTLTYSLSGPDAALFDVDPTNGQLKTKASVDYTVKLSYYITLTVSDGKLTDEIVVVIEVPENKPPMFSAGEITLRTIRENITAGTAIGDVVSAVDENNDTLTYSLGGVDATFFDLDTATGQLKAKTSVDYKTKSIYYLRLTVSDGSLTDDIIIIIDIQQNRPPVFPEGYITMRRIPENTPHGVNIGNAVSAIDEDKDILTYSLGGVDASLFAIDSNTGQLKTKLGLDFEKKQVCFLRVFVTDGAVTDNISVLIAVINTDDIGIAPMLIPVSERTPEVRDAIVAVLPNVDSADEVTAAQLATIPELMLRETGITKLKRGDFSGLTGLVSLNLYDNQLVSLPFGIFEGLTSLSMLRLGRNLSEPFPLLVSIQQVREGVYQAIIPVGAPFDIVLPIEITNGIITNGRISVTIPQGSLTSPTFTVMSTTGSLRDTYVDIGVLPKLPIEHFGYVIAKSTVCNRTPQVSDAITKTVYSVTDCYNVTDIDLARIESLDLSEMAINSLRGYDFLGMLSLSKLSLRNNELMEIPDGLFYRLVSLTEIDLRGNTVDPLPLIVSLEKVEEDTFRVIVPAGSPFDIELPITIVNGSIDNDITSITIPKGSIKSRTFTGTRTLGSINPVFVNLGELPDIPILHEGYVLEKDDAYSLEIISRFNTAPVFTEGTNTTRSNAENTVAGVNIGNALTATDPEGDTLIYSLRGEDANIFRIDSNTGQLRTFQPLDYESKISYSVIVTVTDEYNASTNINVRIIITDVDDNRPPTFVEGNETTRTVDENTEPGENIGSPVSATDAENDTLTYQISGNDAAFFHIYSTTGQLQTLGPLDYERKSTYTLTVTVSDGKLKNSIIVTISVRDVNENRAPVFTEGDSTNRSVAEKTPAGTNIGIPISATDENGDTLTYSHSGTDADLFEIDSKTGQLKIKSILNYESKIDYAIVVSVSDGEMSASIDVTINVTNVNDAPVFSVVESITLEIAEKSVPANTDIGPAVTAKDEDNNTLTYYISGDDAIFFEIDSKTGQLKTKENLNFDTKSSYTVIVSVTDHNGGTDSITVIISKKGVNVSPVFIEGSSTTRTIIENTGADVEIGIPVLATDVENDTLTYILDGTDATSFSIDTSSGQIKTRTPLDYETKLRYSVTVSVLDNKGGRTSINVTITVTDTNDPPVFIAGNSTTLTVAENTIAGQNIGAAVSATDQDGDNLTYSLGGTDADSFDIDSSSGQLKTKVSLDYEAKSKYDLKITVSDDDRGSDIIVVTILILDQNVTRSNNAPVFNEGSSTTRTVVENTSTGIDIGPPVSATDQDKDNIIYSLSGTDAASFNIDSSSGQIRTNAALDYESKSTYSVSVSVTDNNSGSDTIAVTIAVTDIDENIVNNAPIFTDGTSTTRSIPENTASDFNIGEAVSATDQDSDTLTYSLGGTDADAFDIVSNSGQIKTEEPLDFETKSTYSVSVSVTDNKGGRDSIAVTIEITDVDENIVNNAPIFTDGTSTTRSIPENATPDFNIGEAVSATDQDSDTLTYSLGGTDSSSFNIVSTSGQIKAKDPLDFETKPSYSVTVSVTDNNGGTDTIDVIITISNENDAPTFSEGTSTTRSVSEHALPNENIGAAVSATDQDNDNLTYSLGGTVANSFEIVSTSGQIKTKDPLDFETKPSYSVTVSVTDNNGGTDTIAVTITISDENDAPTFSEADSTTRTVSESTGTGIAIGDPVSAIDPDNDNLIYSLGGTDAVSFDIDTNSGQLRTNSPLDFENKITYSVSVSVIDNKGGSDTIAVTIAVTDIDENTVNSAPEFTDGPSTTRRIPENTPADVDIGDAVSADDTDNDTLTYSLGGTDADSFDIVNTSGQIKTKDPLDFETKPSYAVSVSVTDNNGGSDSIDVTITITNANDAPLFSDGTNTTRSVPENTASNVDIETAVSATDQDNVNLTYSLGGTDANSFDIVNTSGQLKTKDPLDFETKPSYAVSVSVTDNNGGSDSIDVTITITNANDAPLFSDGTNTTRSVPENTASNVDIETAVSATDQDNVNLTYSLGGTDANSFDIVNTSGQLKTKDPLDFETKPSYAVSVSATDNNGGSDSIDVTISVSDVNEAPEFTEGSSASRIIAENTAAETNIGDPVTATDPEDNNLTYTLGGTDADSFDIDDSSGQIKTKNSLNFESKQSYTVIVSVTDNTNPIVSITVTINVTDVEPETVAIIGRTQQVIDAIIDAIPGVTTADEVTAEHLASIASLDLQSKEITILQANDFDGLTSLETLYLQNNSLESLPGDIFDENSLLTTLDLSGNMIASLSVNIFNDISLLTILNLSGNELRSLPLGIFNFLTSLICLDLSSNDLESLDSDIFDVLIFLEKLDLSSNDLESLASDIFDGLTMLTSLDLNSNEFTSLHSDIFDELTSLTYLSITDNEITSLPSDLFDELISLTTLDISSLSFTSLPSDLFDELSSLLSLYLADNGLTALPAAASDLTTVLSLNLSSNPLSLTVGMFDGLTSLTELILSDIGISSIPTGFFDSLTQLTSLVMSENPISSLSGNTFSQLTSLENLNLSGNQLSSLPDGLFVGLVSLTSVNLTKPGLPLLRLEPALEKVEEGKLKAVLKTGSPYTMTIHIDVVGGATVGFDYALTIPGGSAESETLTVVRGNENAVNAVSAYIGHIDVFDSIQQGFSVVPNREPIEVLSAVGNAPIITPNSIAKQPKKTLLFSNYPNPFNPETWIPFQLSKPAEVTLRLYNIKGQIVRKLALGYLPAGYYKNRSHSAYWDGRNKVGEKVSAGIYFYTIQAGDYSATRKMLILK